MKKILFVIDRYPGYGGIENVTTWLANYFVSQGVNVLIYSFRNEDAEHLIQCLDHRVIWVQASCPDVYKTEENIRQMVELVDKGQFDYTIMQDDSAPMEQVLLKAELDKRSRLISVWHNSPDCMLTMLQGWKIEGNILERSKQQLQRMYRYVRIYLSFMHRLRLLYRCCFKYVLLSDKYVPIWQRMSLLGGKKKLMVLNNPITSPAVGHYIASKDKVCLFVGRFVPEKGVDKLLKIWEIVEQHNREWQLVFLGDGPLFKQMNQMAVSLGLKNVRFEGFCVDPTPFYKKAAILCETSSFEGWPLTLGEAMSNSCLPVVYNSYAAADDILKDGKSGILVPPYHKAQFASELLRLFSDSDLLDGLRYGAYQRSLDFNIEKIGDQWMSLLYSSDRKN